MESVFYIRTLKKADYTVFCVADGQKSYWDPQFQRAVPYSSGQQVKRSMMTKVSDVLNVPMSPVTFISEVNKKKEISEGEVYGTCDPTYVDQLFGGWMRASKGGKERTLKRRSPLSISAMRGLHPLLAGIAKENGTFDRSGAKETRIVVNEGDKTLSEAEISELLAGKDRSLSRKWLADNKRATGLFVMDVAVDLRRLFSVSLDKLEPEISEATEGKLREEGWLEVETAFGKSLTAPKEVREAWIPALAEALVNWSITSNQSRTFSLMDTLAIAVSDNANRIAGSIRAKLKEDETPRAEPIVEEAMPGVDTFISLSADGVVRTTTEQFDAVDKAVASIIERMRAFDYESPLS
ncbi:hypothetical protein K5X82_01990 [Halosquirtibacter xylanolyticus]|uniref:hypothetical protein n=1 Tax=Halosquirtibacter xylanolyticus TaxID=3374599 RepID=UPI00374832D5|nr:hypothetical protein K5X82_01990 [Prolixibacteraceae bacterium]